MSLRRSSELKTVAVQCLDLMPEHGDLLGQPYWEMNSAWLGDVWTLNSGVSPREERGSSLSRILEGSPHPKYYLSQRACRGILRRARERGKELPEKLERALQTQAGLILPHDSDRFRETLAFAANQRDEVRDLRDVTGTLGAQSGMKQQTFIASFSAGAGACAGGIGYSEAVAPTLKGTASGNCMPSILCLNDQGGQRMGVSREITGTLRAQMEGHPPLVLASQQGGADIGVGICPTITAAAGMSGNNQPVLFENHGVDSRYTGPHNVSPTISARAGTGGNNLPLVEQEPIYCITGNAIDRQPQNGGNGIGYQEDIAYTLTSCDRHAVYSRQRVDIFQNGDVASTQSARQYKDATDLVIEPASEQFAVRLIRRLTPLECERLQGFPDGWTDIPGASDSARYKALGNSVAIPCVEYIMQGMHWHCGQPDKTLLLVRWFRPLSLLAFVNSFAILFGVCLLCNQTEKGEDQVENRRNLCAQIPEELHARVRKEQESLNLTLSQYVEQVLTEYYEQKEGKNNMSDHTKTLAFQIPQELFDRIQNYLDAPRQQNGTKLTQKAFIIGLIEQALEEWENSSGSQADCEAAE